MSTQIECARVCSAPLCELDGLHPQVIVNIIVIIVFHCHPNTDLSTHLALQAVSTGFVPGAFEDDSMPLQLLRLQQPIPDGADAASNDSKTAGSDMQPGWHADGRRRQGNGADGAGGSEASGSVAGDANVSDYKRGKRLRQLKRLLSSRATLQVITSFRMRVLLLTLCVLLLHAGGFATLISYLTQQEVSLTEVSAAGSVMDALHRIATLSLVLDAAERGHGFSAADVNKYVAELEDAHTRYGLFGTHSNAPNTLQTDC